MPITTKTQKMLWGRAAGRCSFPGCRIKLVEDATETDDPALVGENCHIVAEADGGPRADPAMPLEQRNKYANLILLCRNHHKIIDDQEGEYTVPRVQALKAVHEAWVQHQLDFDVAKQRDDEQYADIIETWELLAHLDQWLGWSSFMLASGQPRMSRELDRDLFELREWLLNRVWPKRYPQLDAAFENFRRVLQDLQETFREHSEPWEAAGVLATRKFYQSEDWDEERYRRLGRAYGFHVDLVEDLMLELTRAANLICDEVRQCVIPHFRLRQGRLLVESGPHDDGGFRKFSVTYSASERARPQPYPGLAAFLLERAQRDKHFGQGTAP